MNQNTFPVPAEMHHSDGKPRFAYATFLMLNESYLPGCLVVADALRRQQTRAELVCLVTGEVSPSARLALEVLYDHVLEVPKLFVPHRRRQERQDRPWLCTRFNILRLGADGDLGVHYDRVVGLDADVLPLHDYDHLFTLNTPAGILNENKANFVASDDQGRFITPADIARTGKWGWHSSYDPICPHGTSIPASITNRVRGDPSNMGINGALYVLQPDLAEFNLIRKDVLSPEILPLIGDRFDWPETQYLTLRWSGRWTSVDIRFCGFNGYPGLEYLCGTHFAGVKPWQFKREQAIRRYSRYPDFQMWYRCCLAMLADHPRLLKNNRLQQLRESIKELGLSG